ncbi:hypothetical protein M2137_002416 [Parabacteroides sp. PFB2-10]|uniref:NVEALA domain-containing protein n=1 Tax=Parabacteroides sp. PFB2-10 TaxID=1742405 RepID=UPI00247363DD|nr:NVEALA domain-containing protein [Parabacteroides sp. PFB2-10]MDH6313626.1 hypothetical protein [Parabacteroides sp. PFB2-10]MDL2245415.1 NVEALA domain-containing protein [Parabacteroides sp. OttesenSCG-928-J18]
MKKKIIGLVMVAAIAAAGWNVYQSGSQVSLSELGLANVEALAQDETELEDGIKGECRSSLVIVVDCQVRCPICGTIWKTDPIIPKANAVSVSGKCSKCGNTHWGAYN